MTKLMNFTCGTRAASSATNESLSGLMCPLYHRENTKSNEPWRKRDVAAHMGPSH